ncbi:unnamed protein product [Mycena citricolor]|uniref:Uncharacterized protein n=1 Tax=Mycena citricolor TaxID=2018698 RepID=A0AAD2HP30_9AGAR|nr:unnamed protein product [Mycena citricolor]
MSTTSRHLTLSCAFVHWLTCDRHSLQPTIRWRMCWRGYGVENRWPILGLCMKLTQGASRFLALRFHCLILQHYIGLCQWIASVQALA